MMHGNTKLKFRHEAWLHHVLQVFKCSLQAKCACKIRVICQTVFFCTWRVPHAKPSPCMSYGSRCVQCNSCNPSVNTISLVLDCTIDEKRAGIRFLWLENVETCEEVYHCTETSIMHRMKYQMGGNLSFTGRDSQMRTTRRLPKGFARNRGYSLQITAISWT